MAYYEFTIAIADPFRDALIKRLMDKGCLGVIEGDDSLIAYFPENADIKTISDDLLLIGELLRKPGRDSDLTFNGRLIPDQDWNESWKQSFKPVDAGSLFTVIPPWEEKRTGRVNLLIDPAMAFGTGHHETTRSCLVLIEKYAGRTGKELFLDLGTGTGILAIAASKLGFHRVVAADTDPLAVDAARKNSQLNGVRNVEIRAGSVADLDEAYDFIAANLISGALVKLAPELAAHLRHGGIAVLSGILTGQEDDVIGAMRSAGLKLIERYRDGKWVSLVVHRGL